MQIFIQQGELPARRFTEGFTLGRSHTCQVRVTDDYASPLHAAVGISGEGWAITDCGSMNGTWVNGERVRGLRRLAKGDAVRVGRTTFTVVPD